MARRADFYLTVGQGELARSVGYSVSDRGTGYLGVRFTGPNGERLERMTGAKKKDATYHTEVAKILVAAFPACFPPKDTGPQVSWDDAIAKTTKATPDLRADTLIAYTKAVRILRTTLDADGIATNSPSEITPALATRFARVWLAGTFTRSPRSDAKQYKRSPQTLAFYLRQLSALWSQFADLGFTVVNPWKEVRKPKTDRVRKAVPTEDEVNKFFAWVKARYPHWERLHALLELKAMSGCRTSDLCQLRADQLTGGRIVWDADQTKQREGRAVLLPPDLYATLQRLAGKRLLWEGMYQDAKQYRPSKNHHAKAFSPRTLFWLICSLFREFVKASPALKHLTPHSLRRRAITLTVEATQSVDATASAIGLNPATARKYYLDSRRAFDTDALFTRLAGVLRPGIGPANPPQIGEQPGTTQNTGEQQSK